MNKINHPDRTIYYVDNVFESSKEGETFYYFTIKVLGQTIPIDGDIIHLYDPKKITKILIPVFNKEKECFDDFQEVNRLISILGDDDECFYD